MKKAFAIGAYRFKTKGIAQDYIRSIVGRHADEQSLDSDTFDFVMALLSNHPSADVKIGPGIERIIVRRNPVWRHTRGFHLFRVDGTDTDFSWTECLRPTPHHKKVMAAMRVLVEPQIAEFRKWHFATQPHVCVLTGETITFIGSHVDHIPPFTFTRLVDDFCAAYGIDLAKVRLHDEFADNKHFDMIDDAATADTWMEYHSEHARLRVVSRLGNLSHSKLEAQSV